MTHEEPANVPSPETQDEESITKEFVDLTFGRSENFVEAYANYVSFATSPWDLTIMFGRTVADNPCHPHIEQRVSISLSLQTAKPMAHMLLRNLRTYEQQYGEIRYIPIQPQTEEPEKPSA